MADVGIVMPVYQQKRRLLRAAIKSILNQTYENFRLYIVFDGADGEVRHAARSIVAHDKRVRYIVCGHNHGVASALNRGFHRLLRDKSIRYLTWVSSDNAYYAHYIEVLRHALRHKGSKVGLAYSCFRHTDERGHSVFGQDFQADFRTWQAAASQSLLDACFVGTSFMYKRRYAQRVGGYHLEPVEDYDYWLRLAEVCDLTFVPQELMDYRVNTSHSVSRQLQSPEQHRRWRRAFNQAKYEARVRRRISAEVTVVFPVHDASDATIQAYDALLEQYYSNYKVLLVDRSRSGGVAESLMSRVPDPRANPVHLPRASDAKIARYALRRVKTPLFILYDPQRPLTSIHLQEMTAMMKQLPQEVIAVAQGVDGSMAQRTVKSSLDPVSGELYRRSAM